MNKDLMKKIRGPIAIFGAGGFIGINLLQSLLKYRVDVVGFSHDPKKSWRLKKALIPNRFIDKCDLNITRDVKTVVDKYHPQTIFNLSAYGSYSWDNDLNKIYQTNFNSTATLIEQLKKRGFTAYIHAGSQSEYGLNASAPKESDEPIPNSHYAVSKLGVRYLISYYGKVEKLPVVHLRLYSIYGPWEEPKRLMPTLIQYVKQQQFPKFVAADISRDFVYIDDCIEALVTVAVKIKKKYYGDVFNIASGKKTNMKDLAYLAKKLFNIKDDPIFGKMRSRSWDVTNWWGNPEKIVREFGWRAQTSLANGLVKLYEHATKT